MDEELKELLARIADALEDIDSQLGNLNATIEFECGVDGEGAVSRIEKQLERIE